MEEIFIKSLRDIKIQEIGSVMFNQLESYSYFLSIEEYIRHQFNKSCSRKVESHIIITRSLFLMNYLDMYVDFENKKIFIIDIKSNELYIKYSNDTDLYNILSAILKYSKYDSDISFKYEDYRNETRKIFDNLDKYENKSLMFIWESLLKLSIKWFGENI